MGMSKTRYTARIFHAVRFRRHLLQQVVLVVFTFFCCLKFLIERHEIIIWSKHNSNDWNGKMLYRVGKRLSKLIEGPKRNVLEAFILSKDLRIYLRLANDARAAFGLSPPEYNLSPSTSLGAAPLSIAQYSNIYGPSATWSDSAAHFQSCSLPCKAIGGYGNFSAAQEADVVIIKMQSFSLLSIPWVRPPNQLWVGVYFESMGNYPVQGGEEVLQHFNYTMGYRPDADFPIFAMVYDTFKHYSEIRDLPLPDWESKTRPDRPHLSVWISNCNTETTGRMQILSELASANITIASYGRCQKTHTIQLENVTADGQWEAFGRRSDGEALVAMAAQHLFFYAAENSACTYYITEKVFHGLLAGSVPIYVGDSANLKVIAPPDSIIFAADFADSRELAKYLTSLIESPHAYQRHLAWRDHPSSSDKLQRLMDLSEWEQTSPARLSCALCEFMHQRPRRVSPVTDMCS